MTQLHGASLNYVLITPSEIDASLRAAWCGLLEREPAFASPYFHPEFTIAVGQVRKDVRVVVIQDAGRPVGFFPHQRGRLGLGKPVGGSLSDYHGVIAPQVCDWDLREVLRTARISVFPFDHLVGGESQFGPFIAGRASSPRMDLSCGYEAYAKGRREAGSEYIKKTEGLARKLGRDIGPLRLEVNTSDGKVLDQLIAWKQAQYREAKTTDVFGVDWTGRLLRNLAQTRLPDFAGVLSALWVGDRLVAAHIGIRTRTTLHYWFPAYDPELAKFSTGIILLLRIAESLAPDGLQSIDLGKGEGQYKERLMTGATELAEGCVELPSLLSTARRWQRRAEQSAQSGGPVAALRLPLRLVRKIGYARKFD